MALSTAYATINIRTFSDNALHISVPLKY